jgi:hypothetical protein
MYTKSTTDNLPFSFDWTAEMAKLGNISITSSTWTVDAGSITIGADGRSSIINGNETLCYIQNGKVGEICVFNNSITLDNAPNQRGANKKVKRFYIEITG